MSQYTGLLVPSTSAVTDERLLACSRLRKGHERGLNDQNLSALPCVSVAFVSLEYRANNWEVSVKVEGKGGVNDEGTNHCE